MTTAFADLRGAQLTTKAACALIGRPRASHYRQRAGPLHGPKEARLVPDNGQALTEVERTAVLTLINTGGCADLSIGQIWARELDEGRYLCSMSTMYRIARSAGQTRERRRQATHPAKIKPELLARAPSQVWSWDITKLRGPSKGIYYHLYVLIDIFSRYNPGWLVSTCEESHLAADFIADAIGRNGQAPHSVHADRGTSMTSKPVSMLLTDLGVTRSHSRPHVSNDNPYSEAQYRTLKYLPISPTILFHWSTQNNSAPNSSTRTTTFIAIPASAGTRPHPCTSAPLTPSTTPAEPPSPRPTRRTRRGSADDPIHRPDPTRPGSTNPKQSYPNELSGLVSLDLTDTAGIEGEIGTCDEQRGQTVRCDGSAWPAGVGGDVLRLWIPAHLNGSDRVVAGCFRSVL